MTQNNKIAGFDLSLTSTGVSLKDKTFALSTKYKGIQRLDYYYEEFMKILKDSNVKVAILENYAYNSPYQREALAELGGVFKLACFKCNVTVVSVAPTTLKKYVTNNGRAKKDVVRLEAYKKWGIEFNTNDEVDAYALRMFGNHLINPDYGKVYEKETISRFTKKLEKSIRNELKLLKE